MVEKHALYKVYGSSMQALHYKPIEFMHMYQMTNSTQTIVPITIHFLMFSPATKEGSKAFCAHSKSWG